MVRISKYRNKKKEKEGEEKREKEGEKKEKEGKKKKKKKGKKKRVRVFFLSFDSFVYFTFLILYQGLNRNHSVRLAGGHCDKKKLNSMRTNG